jgi:hypothetical protein
MPEQNRDYLGRFSSPFSGYSTRMTSRFGRRASPWGIGSRRHPGVDLSAGPGVSGYPAQSIAGGIVTHAGRMGGYGNLVEVEHENGYRSRYGHLQSIGVRVGDYIARGTPIGLVGSTGRSTGAHLHLEVRDPTGKAVNPRAFVDFTQNVPTPTERPAPGPVESPPDNIMAAFGMDAQPPSTAALGALSALAGAPSANIDPSRFGGLDATPDPSRFGGLPSMPDPSRFGGMPAMGPTSIDQSRFGPPSIPDPARFGGMPSMASASMPASAPPSMPSMERFGYTPDIDPSRFAGMPSVPSASMPASPMGEYASAVGNPEQQISQGWAGNLMGVPAASVPTSSVDPNAMPSNALAMSYAPPDINMGVPNTFQPGPEMTAALPEPNMPMAMPEQAPALPPPTTVANMPVAGIPAADQSMPMSMPSIPSLSAGDIYGGAFGSAYANDGSLVGRDAAGNTTVTNQYGATTATTPTGQQAAYMGPGGMKMPSIPGPARGLVGGLVGGAAGTAVAGPIGGLIGGLIGKAIASKAFGNGGYASGFPSAPSTAGQRQGPALSQRDRDSISPAASRSMDRNGGAMTGLW